MNRHLKPNSAPAESKISPTARGRPATREHRDVSEEIVHATERCLEDKYPHEISIREIAKVAGVQAAMIFYYFGSKGGLFDEIVRRGYKNMQLGFLRLRDAIKSGRAGNPTRSIVEQFIECYEQNPAMCKILAFGSQRENKPMEDEFWPSSNSSTTAIILDSLDLLSRSGYYRQEIQPRHVVSMIRGVILSPLVERSYFMSIDKSKDHYRSEGWIDFVTTVLDAYLRDKPDEAAIG